MSKIKRLRKRFTAFVNQLTPDQCREQLVLAYLQMEKCQNVLKGYDVEPVEMMDNGDSSDLELFYRCKKAAEELACLNDELFHLKEDYLHLKAEDFLKGQNNNGRIPFTVKVDVSEEVKRLKKIAESFKELGKNLQPRQLTLGHEVYFLSKGRIHKSILQDFIGMVCDGTGEVVCRVKGYENGIPARYLFGKADELAKEIGKVVSNHVSLSSDHESAFFIDSTSRIFRGAKWYLEEQGIKNFETINDLRKFLLENIIDDGKQG